jgi:hypothetical protein
MMVVPLIEFLLGLSFPLYIPIAPSFLAFLPYFFNILQPLGVIFSGNIHLYLFIRKGFHLRIHTYYLTFSNPFLTSPIFSHIRRDSVESPLLASCIT